MNDASFTPALGRASLTAGYDVAIRFLTRERLWRDALLSQIAPRSGETILDVGCGTGTFAMMLKRAAPRARIIAMDPDPRVLALAAAKAERAGLDIEWRRGFARDAAEFAGSIDKAVSSLVFHQVHIIGKREGIIAILAAVRAGGEIHVADYARQRGRLMRTLFRLTVQMMDGLTDTQASADGALEIILGTTIGGEAYRPTLVIPTPTGAISLFRAIKPTPK